MKLKLFILLGVEAHALAGPTKLETLKKEFKKQRSEVSGGIKQDLLDKYGGQVILFVY